MSDLGDSTSDRAAGTPFAVCGFSHARNIIDGAAGSFQIADKQSERVMWLTEWCCRRPGIESVSSAKSTCRGWVSNSRKLWKSLAKPTLYHCATATASVATYPNEFFVTLFAESGWSQANRNLNEFSREIWKRVLTFNWKRPRNVLVSAVYYITT